MQSKTFESIQSGTPGADLKVVMFHGYGADMYDLQSLSHEAGADLEWHFPNGPLSIFPAGKAWFHIDIQALERAMQMGQHRDLSKERPRGLDKVIEQAQEYIASLEIDSSQLILGGFSQGSMLAVELALRHPKPIAGLIILSGNLLDAKGLKGLKTAQQGLRYFQSHGQHDPLLSLEGARALECLLHEKGLKGELAEFRGGHEIPYNTLQALKQFLVSIHDGLSTKS